MKLQRMIERKHFEAKTRTVEVPAVVGKDGRVVREASTKEVQVIVPGAEYRQIMAGAMARPVLGSTTGREREDLLEKRRKERNRRRSGRKLVRERVARFGKMLSCRPTMRELEIVRRLERDVRVRAHRNVAQAQLKWTGWEKAVWAKVQAWGGVY